MEGWGLAGTCLDLGEGLEVHVKGRVGGWWCCHDAGLMFGVDVGKVDRRQGGPPSADKPASSGSQWVRLRNSMWGFGRLPILWTHRASRRRDQTSTQATGEPVLHGGIGLSLSNHSTCPNAACRRHDGKLHLPLARGCAVPSPENPE